MSAHYHAFISYAHADESLAKWLQRSLERYRVPKELAAEGSEAIPKRLFPIFRDRDELASSADLSQSIRDSLDQSGALIVLCSPASANSKWVNEEVREFQRLGRADRIFCLLVAGSPDREAADCAFPPALLVDDQGRSLPDPLAADINPASDGKRGALLKIAAGLLGVGVDSLRQRDAQQQLRRRGIVSITSATIAVVTLALAVTAQLAREEADLRRGQAEGLISFMMGDLRDRLAPLGRLDVLDSVGDEALEYFDALGERGTENELFARVMALRQIGEVRFRQGQYAKAEESFIASRDLATHLRSTAKDNNEYLFELGQAEFWVGYAGLEQGDLLQAERSFEKYMEYSRELLATDPDDAGYQLELSYAYSNLGTVSLDRRKAAAALGYFQLSAEINQALVDANPDDAGMQLDLGNGYSWIGAAQLDLGRLDESDKAYRRALDILNRLDEENDSPLFSENRAQNAYHLANVRMQQGDTESARELLVLSGNLLDGLVKHDPENAVWRVDRAINTYYRGEWLRAAKLFDDARSLFSEAREDFTMLLDKDPGNTRSAEHLALVERSLGIVNSEPQMLEAAYRRVHALIDGADSIKSRTAFTAALVTESHGQALWSAGAQESAQRVWREALSFLRNAGNPVLKNLALEGRIRAQLGEAEKAVKIARDLETAGFRDPRFGD